MRNDPQSAVHGSTIPCRAKTSHQKRNRFLFHPQLREDRNLWKLTQCGQLTSAHASSVIQLSWVEVSSDVSPRVCRPFVDTEDVHYFFVGNSASPVPHRPAPSQGFIPFSPEKQRLEGDRIPIEERAAEIHARALSLKAIQAHRSHQA